MSNSDEYLNRSGKSPVWNQIFMHNDNDGPKTEDYKISSSLKTIWSDASDGRTISRNINEDSSQSQVPSGCFTQEPQSQTMKFVQFGNNVIAIGNGAESIQSKPARAFGAGSDNAATLSNDKNLVTSLKGRAIIARNGCHIANFGNENPPSHASILSGLLPHQQSQPLETFLQKVKVIVKNGFLDPKILSEPISPETFDLVQMLIFYVMEYSRARSHSNSDEIENTFYKINLIQNEISRCQLQYVQQKRVQQEIMQSFSTPDGLPFKQQNFTSQPSLSQHGHGHGSMTSNANNNQWCNGPKTEQYDMPNQRFGQRQYDQFGPQSHAGSTGKFAFLPKAKNIDKRPHSRTPNGYFSQRDGNFTKH